MITGGTVCPIKLPSSIMRMAGHLMKMSAIEKFYKNVKNIAAM
jgi:hypothetical protein